MDLDPKPLQASSDRLLERATALAETALQCAKDGAQAANRLHHDGDVKAEALAELTLQITRGKQAIKDAQELIVTGIPAALQNLEGGASSPENGSLALLQRRVLDAESQLRPLKRLRQKLLHDQVEQQCHTLQDSINRMKAKHAPAGTGQHRPELLSTTENATKPKLDASACANKNSQLGQRGHKSPYSHSPGDSSELIAAKCNALSVEAQRGSTSIAPVTRPGNNSASGCSADLDPDKLSEANSEATDPDMPELIPVDKPTPLREPELSDYSDFEESDTECAAFV